MMKNTKLLYTAAFFTLFTFVGHSVGTLLPHAPVNAEIAQVQTLMQKTLVEMPIGPAQSLAHMAYGGNAFISLYLLTSGLLFILLAKKENVRSLVLLNSLSMLICAVFSAIFYFPVPAICTGLAAILGLIAARES